MSAIRVISIFAAIALTGCASNHAYNPADPLESFNRGVYQFNDAVDKAVAKPIAQGYSTIMPEFGKTMVTNFFSNLDDIIVTGNDLLQFKFIQGFTDGMRFLINTTVGIYGLFDVASFGGLEKHNEDFGQTLGKWGIGSGPYIVIPILGPSTLRDSVGLYADNRPSRLRRVEHMRTRNQMYATDAINHRSQLLDQEKILDEAVIDRYEFIRDAYLLRRKSLVFDGNPPREQYDDDEEGGAKHGQTPISDAPSSQHSASAISPANATARAVSEPNALQIGDDRPGVRKMWIAQRSGIR